jgi:hypothetical protein
VIARLAKHEPRVRNRLTRIEPLWPIPALTPLSRCPHGVKIYPGRVCGICHGATKTTQHQIDVMPVPEPKNPEDQALEQIAFFRNWLEDHPTAPTRTKIHIVRQISRLEADLREWVPTKYRPDRKFKGGKDK